MPYEWKGAEVLRSVETATKSALFEFGDIVKNEADQLTPKWKGDLRESAFVRSDRASRTPRVLIGNSSEYAAPHYFGSFKTGKNAGSYLRHLFDGQGNPIDLTTLKVDGAAGAGQSAIYSRSLRFADKNGFLERVPEGLQWFHRAAKRPKTQRAGFRAFVRSFNSNF